MLVDRVVVFKVVRELVQGVVEVDAAELVVILVVVFVVVETAGVVWTGVVETEDELLVQGVDVADVVLADVVETAGVV